MKIMRLIVASLAFGTIAASANAQETSQVRLAGEPSTAEDRLILQRFSRCVAERLPDRVRELIQADYTTDDHQNVLRRMATSQFGCLRGGGQLRFGGVLFVGNMAEALLGGVAPRGSLAQRTLLNPALASFRARSESEMMSICVVRAAPAQTEALFAAGHGSAEETAALRGIAPHVGPCLASGAEMRLNRAALRAMLALAAYRLVQHNSAVAPAAAAGN